MENSEFLIIGVVSVLAIIFVLRAISRLLIICHPNEVIVLSGRDRKMADGQNVGYRLIKGGRTLRIPLIEKAARMSLETIPIDLAVTNAYSKGGIPLSVDAIANIKINSSEQTFNNAVERFLGKPQDEIHQIAKDTLEGNLRGVLAALTPEEVNTDRLKFAQSLIDEAEIDLEQLGLQLDTLKITNISDDRGYLDSIGRRISAEVVSQARKAEAERQAEAEEAEAESQRRAEVAKARSEQEIKTARIMAKRQVEIEEAGSEQAIQEAKIAAKRAVDVENAKSDEQIRRAQIAAQRTVEVEKAKAQQEIEVESNNLRVRKAELEKQAIIREREAEIAGERARVQFEQEVEKERIELQQRRLMADVIEPARAKKEAAELEAKGAAAKILEDGAAQLKVVREMIEAYRAAGGDGDKIFMLRMLPDIVSELVDTVNKVSIEKVSVIDNGGGPGGGVGRFINQLPSAVLTLSETLENATGVNILSQFQNMLTKDDTGKSGKSGGKPNGADTHPRNIEDAESAES